jgi:antitoxin HicB
MAADALRAMIQEHIRKGEEIPRPSKPRPEVSRDSPGCPGHDQGGAILGISASAIQKVELARRLGIPKTTVDRLFDLDHHSRLDQIEGAFAALGKRLAVEVQDAA